MAKAKVEIQQALTVISNAIKSFDPGTKEFEELHSAYKKLSKTFGTQESKELSDSGLKMLASAISPKGMAGIMGGGGGGGAPQGITPPMPGPMGLGGM